MPDYIFPSLTSVQLKSSTHGMQEAMIPIERLKGSLNQASPLLHLYSQLVTQYEGYQTSTNAFPAYMEKTGILIQSYIDYVMFHNRYQKNTSEAYLLKLLDKIYSIVMNLDQCASENGKSAGGGGSGANAENLPYSRGNCGECASESGFGAG